jgi:hypothetical protein
MKTGSLLIGLAAALVGVIIGVNVKVKLVNG